MPRGDAPSRRRGSERRGVDVARGERARARGRRRPILSRPREEEPPRRTPKARRVGRHLPTRVDAVARAAVAAAARGGDDRDDDGRARRAATDGTDVHSVPRRGRRPFVVREEGVGALVFRVGRRHGSRGVVVVGVVVGVAAAAASSAAHVAAAHHPRRRRARVQARHRGRPPHLQGAFGLSDDPRPNVFHPPLGFNT